MNSFAIKTPDSPSWLFRGSIAIGMAVLAWEPVCWLMTSWQDAAYDSSGAYVALLVLVMFLWSATSPLCRHGKTHRNAWLLLAASSTARLLGQVLAVNILSAATLVLDVYALGLLVGLHRRKRALSPGWLAVVFAFCLPLEQMLQRIIGYGLQQLSTDSACAVLKLFSEDVICHGTRILMQGVDVAVDLPCSGARGALLLLMLYALMMAVRRPGFLGCLIAGMVTLIAAWFANTLRVSILATGMATSELKRFIDVMQQPWHDIIGISCLAAGMTLLLAVVRLLPCPHHATPLLLRLHLPLPAIRPGAAMGIAFLLLTFGITHLPRTPVDVSIIPEAVVLPDSIGGVVGNSIPLTSQESAYFTRFGGSAEKRIYDENALLVVKTSAPLRHLHDPSTCLRGMGFDVQYVGAEFSVMPTAIYKATSPNGADWRIAVSFIADDGKLTYNIAEAIWHWLQHPQTQWMAVQRITPWQDDTTAAHAWDATIAATLDINPQSFMLAQGEPL